MNASSSLRRQLNFDPRRASLAAAYWDRSDRRLKLCRCTLLRTRRRRKSLDGCIVRREGCVEPLRWLILGRRLRAHKRHRLQSQPQPRKGLHVL